LVWILFFLAFVVFSLIEKEYRAFCRSLTALLFFILIPFIIHFFFSDFQSLFFIVLFALSVTFFALIFLSPVPRSNLQVISERARIDERDIIFSRFDLQRQSKEYNSYYLNKPELKKKDDRIRRLPDLFDPQHIKKDRVLFSLSEVEFEFLEHMMTLVDGEIKQDKLVQSKKTNAGMIQSVLRYLGAEDSGFCRMDPSDFYSHVGRGPDPYGAPINASQAYGISFVVEMNSDMIRHAPHPPVIVETAKQYVEAAKISVILAAFIRRLGYSARAHIAGSNYQALLVPVAWRAGLGELGRMGILMHPRLGPRIRLGLVTTDLPLETNSPITFGVQDFCEKCLKCALHCPGGAIPRGEKIKENGVFKWVLNREKCYSFWRTVGTDCAACMSVCPYSKPNNVFHNLIRSVAARSSFAQTLSIFGDDLFYGKKPKHKKTQTLFK